MADKLAAILAAVAGVRVLCLGDLMLDRYVYGEATRLSPEAPVPVVVVRRRVHIAGGLGNVVANLAALGARPLAVGLAGDDPEADLVAGLLAPLADPKSPPVIRDPGRPTTVKTRVVAGIQQLVRLDEESLAPLGPEAGAEYLRLAAAALPGAAAVTISDYGKGAVSPDMAASLIALAAGTGVPVVVDPKGGDYGPYRGATLVTPNRQELALACGRDIARARSEVLTAAGFDLMGRHGLKNLLITRSEEGMTLLASDGAVTHLPARAKEVFDVSGAGDTVVAAVAASLAAGLTLADGAVLATAAAGVVVGKVGTASATPGEILAAVRD
jgi:D-beta-D-heptose 7-phosphate kinase/D-beta-D-heptose 1-phosphate adenosyltransferase